MQTPGEICKRRARLGAADLGASRGYPSSRAHRALAYAADGHTPGAHPAIGSGNRARPRLSPTMVRASSIIRIRPIIRVLARGRAATRPFSVARPLDGRACCARPCLAHAETAGVAPWCATVARQAAGAPAGGLETTGMSSRGTPCLFEATELSAVPPASAVSARALRWLMFRAEQRKSCAELCLRATVGGAVGNQWRKAK